MNIIAHVEIPVTDIDRAIAFYSDVFRVGFGKIAEIHGNRMAYFPFEEGKEGASCALAEGEVYVPTVNGAIDQQGDVATFRPLESQPTDEVRFTGPRFTLYDTEGMFARCVRQRLENCAFVSGPNLALMAAPNVESLDGTMGGEENRLVMLQSFVRDNARHLVCTPARLHRNIHMFTSPRMLMA